MTSIEQSVKIARTYAENMVRDVAPTLDHPRQDSTLNLARAEKRWGTPMYSNGYICRRPHRREMSHYDMNLVYIDALLRHIRATGDEDFMEKCGYELLFDCAKFWPSRVSYNAEKDQYDILNVIGANEYKENVDNNACCKTHCHKSCVRKNIT